MGASTSSNNLSYFFQPARLVPVLSVGLLAGALQIMLGVSFAALIFRGPLNPFLSEGIGLAIIAAIIGGIPVALLTRSPGIVSGNQNVPAAIIAIAAVAIGNMFVDSSPESLYVTVAVFSGLTTLFTGATFYLLGRYRLGNLVRFLPYPVVGGFLAGTGWLLLIGGLEIMLDFTPSLATLPRLINAEMALRWLPGLLLAVLLTVSLRRTQNALVLPAAILGGIALFFVVMFVTGNRSPELLEAGWLLGPLPQGFLWQPITPGDFAMVDWSAILRQAPNIATVVLMSTIALLLNGSGLEIALGEDLALDRELRSAGIGNILTAFSGGFVTFQQISVTMLTVKIGGRSRLPGLIAIGFCGFILLGGASILSFFPRLVLGALVSYLGLTFLVDTLLKDWKRLPRADYLIILLILLITAFVGFIEATGVGLLLAVMLFVINYSRIDNIRSQLTGHTAQSRVTRSPEKQHDLIESGDQLLVFRLQGFLFFGTAESLLARIRQRIEEVQQGTLEYLLLDFAHVTGIDSTALNCFEKLITYAGKRQVVPLFSQPPAELQQYFDTLKTSGAAIQLFADIDRALEWCEEERLQALAHGGEESGALQQLLAQRLASDELAARLLAYFERLQVDAGQTLMHQGDAPNTLYLVESGQVSAYLTRPGSEKVRLQTMHDWNVLGEIGFFLDATRTASVEVESPGVVYCLTKQKLQQMQQRDPDLASAFHHLIVQLLAERVVHLVSVVDALRH